jgi:hypothetical protein
MTGKNYAASMSSSWQALGYTSSTMDYLGLDTQTKHMKELAKMVQDSPKKGHYSTADYSVYIYNPVRDTFKGPRYEFSAEQLCKFNVPVSRADRRRPKLTEARRSARLVPGSKATDSKWANRP